MTEYDYTVVGGGSAGCVVATRLSQDPGTRVLLLEAGSSEQTHAMSVPNAWPGNLGSPADWANVTTRQAEAGTVVYPWSRAVGGSGAINAMAHVRGHQAVYYRWAACGAPGWEFADLLPYFRPSENAPRRDPVLRGTQAAQARIPHRRFDPAGDTEGGWGLVLVEALSSRWGWYAFRQRGTAKVVWAELGGGSASMSGAPLGGVRVGGEMPCRG